MNTTQTCSGTGPLKVWVKSSFQNFVFLRSNEKFTLRFQADSKICISSATTFKQPGSSLEFDQREFYRGCDRKVFLLKFMIIRF